MNKKIFELIKYGGLKTVEYNAWAEGPHGATWSFSHYGDYSSFANATAIEAVQGTYVSEAGGRAYAKGTIPGLRKAKELIQKEL